MFKFFTCPASVAGTSFHCTMLVPPYRLMVPGHPRVLLGWMHCHADGPVPATSSLPSSLLSPWGFISKSQL